MTQITKISVALTAEMADLLKQAVESGEYATASEVVRDALRDWNEKRIVRDTLRQRQVEELRRLWEEGLASGPAEPWDVEEIKREAMRLLEEERRSKK